MPYTLSDNLVSLRAVEPADVDTLYILENEISAGGASDIHQPASRQMLWEYTRNYTADIAADRQLRLVVCRASDNMAVGTIDISEYDPHSRRGFIGIAILENQRGNGYARSALMLLCRYAADTLGIHQLAAIVAADNEPSRRLFSGAGFKACGRLRSWLRRGKSYEDALFFQKLF